MHAESSRAASELCTKHNATPALLRELATKGLVTLEEREGRPWAMPPPAIAGLIELRNIGLVTLPAEPAPLALVVRLDTAAPRFIEAAEQASRGGHALPLIALDPRSPVLPLLVEYALKTYGLA